MELATKERYITDHDRRRLERFVRTTADMKYTDLEKVHLRELVAKLEQASVVPSAAIPKGVITMNSRFRLRDLDTGMKGEYTLVFPGGADIRLARLSVLAPVGAALLGTREGETISALTPTGVKRFRVESVLYQPEAAGEHFL